MKNTSELSRAELESIAEQIRDILWRDCETREFDPDKEWSIETIEWVSGVLEDAGLKPAESPALPADPGRQDLPRGDRGPCGDSGSTVTSAENPSARCAGSRVYHDFATEAEARAFVDSLDYANDSDLAADPPYQAGGRWWIKTVDASGAAEDSEPRRPDDPFDESAL